jgi:GNAT superfamily N-acetyltransferase
MKSEQGICTLSEQGSGNIARIRTSQLSPLLLPHDRLTYTLRMEVTIQECDQVRHRAQLRSCLIELQDFERTLEPALPAGKDMADAYLDILLKRCSGNSGNLFVAEVDQGVVGFVGVVVGGSPPEPDEEQSPYGCVSDLVVLSAYRGLGIGRALLERAETYARNSGAALLGINVFTRNQAAAQLYREFGFNDYRIQLIKRLI